MGSETLSALRSIAEAREKAWKWPAIEDNAAEFENVRFPAPDQETQGPPARE
jgi:hypothetical protein